MKLDSATTPKYSEAQGTGGQSAFRGQSTPGAPLQPGTGAANSDVDDQNNGEGGPVEVVVGTEYGYGKTASAPVSQPVMPAHGAPTAEEPMRERATQGQRLAYEEYLRRLRLKRTSSQPSSHPTSPPATSRPTEENRL